MLKQRSVRIAVCLFSALLLALALCGTAGALGTSAYDKFKVVEVPTDDFLQAGGFASSFPDPDGIQGIPDAAYKQLEKRLIEACTAWKTSVSIADLNISVTDFASETLYTLFFNEHPEFFYVQRYSYYADNYVTQIVLQYDPAYSKADAAQVQKAAGQILAGIDPAWGDLEKMLYLHDYIVTHCQYDLTYSKRNLYTVLVEGSSVCQGYSLAYLYLTREAGIKSGYVSSKQINHAWNYVTLDGTTYYVDCTWDDPTFDTSNLYPAYCRHTNFRRSRDGLIETGHGGTDWYADKIGRSTKYDGGAFWSAVECAFYLDGQYAYYPGASEDNRFLVVLRHDFAKNKEEEYGSAGTWPYGTKCIDGKDGIIYLSLDSRIYMFDKYGGAAVLYELTEAEKSEGSIYGMKVDGKKIRYELYKDWTANTYVRSAAVDIPDFTKKVTSISLPKELRLYSWRDPRTLTCTTKPADVGYNALIWSIGDTEVATVENGVVSPRTAGETDVTVRAFGTAVKASCRIVVEDYQYVWYVTPDPACAFLPVGGSVRIGITYSPEEASVKKAVWSSSNEAVAVVDQKGVVTGVGQGSAVITAAASEDSYDDWTSEIHVTVVREAVKEGKQVLVVGDGEGAVGEEVMLDVTWALPGTDSWTDSVNFTIDGVNCDSKYLKFVGFENITIEELATDGNRVWTTERVWLPNHAHICSARFKVLKAAANGPETLPVSVGLTVSESYYEEPVILSGLISLKTAIPGDVNDDGKVDRLDYVILSRYLADWPEYAEKIVRMAAAELDGTPGITAADRRILGRIVAGMN